MAEALDERPLVLVVEDEILLHETIEDALGTAGFATAFVQSAEEAAALLRGHSADYAVLIIDITLRGRMVGWDLAKLARELNPQSLSSTRLLGAGASGLPMVSPTACSYRSRSRQPNL